VGFEPCPRLPPRVGLGSGVRVSIWRLTEDFGHPKLREHLGAVVMAMKLSDAWDEFMGKINRLLPSYLPIEDKRGQRSLRFDKSDAATPDPGAVQKAGNDWGATRTYEPSEIRTLPLST
jgi:hypothetical protein